MMEVFDEVVGPSSTEVQARHHPGDCLPFYLTPDINMLHSIVAWCRRLHTGVCEQSCQIHAGERGL